MRPLSTQTKHQLSDILSTHICITPPSPAFSFLPTIIGGSSAADETLVTAEICKVELEMIGILFVRPPTSRSTDTNVGGPWNPIAESTSESTIMDVWTVIGVDRESSGTECFCVFVQSVTLTALCSPSENSLIQQAAFNLVDEYKLTDAESSAGSNALNNEREIMTYRCDDVRALTLSNLQRSKIEEHSVSQGNVMEATRGAGKRKRTTKGATPPQSTDTARTTAVESTAVDLDHQYQLPIADCPCIACDRCGQWRVWRGPDEELEALKESAWDCTKNTYDLRFAACAIPSVYSEKQQGFIKPRQTKKTKGNT